MSNCLALIALGAQLLVVAPACAQWVRAEGNEDVDVYLDVSTRVVDGTNVRIQVLFDYKQPQQWSDYLVYSSATSTREYDCAGARQRVLASAFHFEAMAAGEPRFSTPGGSTWKALAEDGVEGALWKRACSGS